MLTGPFNARRSNAKTAYGLLSDIAAYALEEPKRIWMGDWLIEGAQQIEDILKTKAPACDTVGCIAGNAVLLTGVTGNKSTATLAMNLLAGDGDDFDLTSDLNSLFLDTDVEANYGTKKYARIVVGRIRDFQKRHEAALRGVRIRVR